MHAKSSQLCPTLCNPMNCSLPGSSVHGILQAILEWVVIPCSRGSSDTGIEPILLCLLHWQAGSLPLEPPGKPFQPLCNVVSAPQSCQLFATPWTVAHQAPLSMGFSRHEYWSGSPFPSPQDLPNPGIKPWSSVLQADSLLSELQGSPTTSCGQILPTLQKKKQKKPTLLKGTKVHL